MAYGGGGAAAAIANAVKASGVIIKVEQNDFQTILSKAEKPLVIIATGGILRKNYKYLTSYKGFAFYTKSETPLMLAGNAETINRKTDLDSRIICDSSNWLVGK